MVVMRVAATVLIVNDDGDVLAVSRRDDPNDWGLPGGKHEDGDETLLVTALRELREETGLLAFDGDRVFSACDDDGYTTTTFRADFKSVSGNIMKEDGGGEVAWVHPSLLLRGSFARYNAALFETIGMDVEPSTSSEQRIMMLKLFVWHRLKHTANYSPGMAYALAESKEQAIKLVLLSKFGAPPYREFDKSEARKFKEELESIDPDIHDEPYGSYEWGSA